MTMSFITVIGSADGEREYEPPMADPEAARQAAVELGRELATRGFGLVIYAGTEKFIEWHVLRGFVDANPERDRCIRLHMAEAGEQDHMGLTPEQTRLLDEKRVDASGRWEVAFYRSVQECDGMILIGGGPSTLNAGLVGIATRKPLVSVSCFGGAASSAVECISAGVDLPLREDVELMLRPWTPAMAGACVASIEGQIARSLIADARDAIWPARVALGLTLLALLLVGIAWARLDLSTLVLFLAPALAGAAGANVRVLVSPGRAFRSVTRSSLEVAAHLGGISGGIVALLFVAAQLSAMPSLGGDGSEGAAASASEHVIRLIPFAVGTAFVAGMTLDRVLRRLLKLDALKRSGLDPEV